MAVVQFEPLAALSVGESGNELGKRCVGCGCCVRAERAERGDEASCRARARRVYAEFFDDRVLSLDQRNSLMELHEPCLSW